MQAQVSMLLRLRTIAVDVAGASREKMILIYLCLKWNSEANCKENRLGFRLQTHGLKRKNGGGAESAAAIDGDL